ncbi:MAG: hypothetical protein JW779_15090 [Candidatus Thorarchaeota archaeon]|nr:hypothetical protein [Candidatus Thorarchaeota archaeon]
MDSGNLDRESAIRKARRIGLIFLVYAIVLPFIVFLLPENEPPISTEPLLLSWIMIFLMPVELLLIYAFSRFIQRNPTPNNFLGFAVLMFALAIAPSIYASIIGFIDPLLRSVAVPLGLFFSLTGFWCTLMYLSSYLDIIPSSYSF